MTTKHLLLVLSVLMAASCGSEPQTQRACTPPLKTWREPHPHLGPDQPEYTISLDRNGKVYVEGKALSFKQLSAKLAIYGKIDAPVPVAILETEMGAPCEALDRVRALMNQRLACERGGHCDEGMQTVWRELPYTGPGVP